MSIMIVESEITHRYLMNKGKGDLWNMLGGLGGDISGLRDLTKDRTKEDLASEIMRRIRAEQLKDAAEPQAAHDLDIPFGAVTTDAEGKRWVFCGWGQTTVSKEALLMRELQPGERISPVTPWSYHCTKTATLLKKFPLLEQYRK